MKKLILFLYLISQAMSSQSFQEIKFEGLTQISQNVALETLNLEKPNQYNESEINKAIKKFYAFKYFNNIFVTIKNNILTFHFEEKPFITKLTMTGYKTREEELKALYNNMNLKKGTMYTKDKIQRAKNALLLELEREGYINSVVEVDIETINNTNVAIKFSVNKGDEIIIKNILYKGAKFLDTSDFKSVIANKEEDCCFTWFFGQNDGEMHFEQLTYDHHRIKDIYLQHGFLDIKVSSAFSKIDFNTNTANIEYTIDEGKQYRIGKTIIYLDDTILNPQDLYPKLKLEKNDIFNIKHLRNDQKYIKTQVANKGYAFAQVKYDVRKNADNKTTDIIYNVIPGDQVYINDVIISGNSRTLDRVIRRNIYLAPEDLFNLTDFTDSKNALKRTGFFETIDIKQERVSSSRINLIVSVSEAATGNLILGGGYGSYDGLMLNASIDDKNIFGSGLNLGFSIDYSTKKTNYKISLLNPALYDSKYSGNFDIHKNTSTVESADIIEGDKVTNEKGFGVGVGKALNRHTRIGITYGFEDVDVTYELNSTNNSSYITSSITPYISFNNTDDYHLPRSGHIASTSLQYAGVGGDAKYILSSTRYKFFHSLERSTDFDIIFRYKNNIKLLVDSGNIPEDTTFYLGGVNSVRGYQSYAIQPVDGNNPLKKYFTNAIELSFPLIPSAKMRWELFYDYGMIGKNSFNEIKKSGTGLAISWNSPIGPLQFIFAKAINPDTDDKTSNFEFNLGGKF